MKRIVNFTPTGMIPTKAMTPHVPVSVSEIVEEVHQAIDGGVRVGLEDAIWSDRERTRLASNCDLLERVHRLAALHERAIMPPQKFRGLLHLAGRGKYGRL